jgi:L(+)-tartrate dehydratase alpha subunit
MYENQRLAMELDRPSCQDTGLIQYLVKCGSNFPLLSEMEDILTNAVLQATNDAPLRHNVVETFDEVNTKKNIGTGAPTIFWDIVPGGDSVEIDVYMSGGGCSLPGRACVLMPSEGYEGMVKFVLDIMTSYGPNACPPFLVGIGVATAIDAAALLSKKALMRPIGSRNSNERAANLEKLLEDGINKIGLGPQGMGGNYSVLGVHIENAARHPSVIAVAVNIGCWSHRRGHIKFDSNIKHTIVSHKEAGI